MCCFFHLILFHSLSLSELVFVYDRFIEQENLLKLAEAKAEFVSEHFGRVRESIFQLRAFAGEAIVQDQDTMVLDSYLASFSGVQQSETSVEHSSW